MNKKKLGKRLLILSFVLLGIGWYFIANIWSIILCLPFADRNVHVLDGELYLSFNMSMMMIDFLIGLIGIKLLLSDKN